MKIRIALFTFALLVGYVVGVAAQPLFAQSMVVGCYAKGGVNVAGWCVSRSVIIR